MRAMAEDIVDRTIKVVRERGFKGALRPCQTPNRPLPGGGSIDWPPSELAPDIKRHLRETYGSRATQVLALVKEDASRARRIVPNLPYIEAEIHHAVRFELVCEVEDVLWRRVPLALFSKDHGSCAVETTANILANERGWSPQRRAYSILQFQTSIASSLSFNSD